MGCFEHGGVDEGLREVPAKLALFDVVFFREQSGGAACGPVAFKEPDCLRDVALQVFRQRQVESAEEEGAFGIGQGTGPVPESVDVSVVEEFLSDRLCSGKGAGVPGGQGSADGRKKKCRVDPFVGG